MTGMERIARDASALPLAGGCCAVTDNIDKEMTMTTLTAIERTARDASLHALALDDRGRAQYAVAYDLGDGRAHVAYTDAPAIAAPVADCAVALAGVIVRSIAGYEQYVINRAETALESIGVKIPANTASNRASVESDIEAAIIELPEWCEHCGADDWNDSHVCNSCGRSPFDVDERDVYEDDFEAESASIEHDGQIDTVMLSDGAGGTPVSVRFDDAEIAHESSLVAAEIAALSAIDADNQTDGVTDTPPRESDGHSVDRPRPKGMTKLRAKVWEWIDQNAGDNHNTDTLSVNKVKSGAGCARGVAGEVLSLYRSWYTDTSRKEKAS
jgi:hypothetical protein